MVKGIGVDIALISRFVNKDEHFIKRILTSKELDEYSKLIDASKVEFLAARFAAKEAFYKAINDKTLSYQSFEVLSSTNGLQTNIDHAHVSISHDGDYVVAMVVIEE